jgi:hypothetical protein
MEYFLGSLITFVIIIAVRKLFQDKQKQGISLNFFQYSQSYSHELVKGFWPTNAELAFLNREPTQAEKHDRNRQLKILMTKEKAYWIKDNAFYNARVENGEILKETTSRVDIMGMDKVQLEEMMFIVEQLTKGLGNDSGNTGQQKF